MGLQGNRRSLSAGRQACKVERNTTDQRGAIGFGGRLQAFLLQPGQHEGINAIARPSTVLDRRQHRSDRHLEGPMLLPLRSLGDPRGQPLDLVCR
jgi:hypothetical protein